MEKWDITAFVKENETPETRAFDHALEIIYLVSIEMEKQGLTQKELAERMGMSTSRLSKLLNSQNNMTLETIAKFELALDMNLVLEFRESDSEDVFSHSAEIFPEVEVDASIVSMLSYKFADETVKESRKTSSCFCDEKDEFDSGKQFRNRPAEELRIAA